MNFSSPIAYNTHLVDNLTVIGIETYFNAYHTQFYPDQDISFMPYFLEMCQHKHEFYVPHMKLFEYGIMSNGSETSDVRKRLNKLKLKEAIHFELGKVSELRNQGGISEKHIYMLKPKAFKKMLMRAGRNSKQTIDVEVYADYYLLLEEVHADFKDYQNAYNRKITSIKDAKIDQQSTKIDKLIESNDKLVELNKDQSEKIDNLLEYAKDTKEELHEVRVELVEVKAQLAKILSAVIGLAYMPHMFKRFYEKDHAGKKVKDGKQFSLTSVGRTKTLVFIATYDPSNHWLRIECINRKLNEPLVQVNKVIDRASCHNQKLIKSYCEEQNINHKYTTKVHEQLVGSFQKVIMPQSYGVSTLNEQEIRSRYSKISKISLMFKDLVEKHDIENVYWCTKFKAITLTNVSSFEIAQECFDTFIEVNQTDNIHSYDQSLEESIIDSGEILSKEALDELKRCNAEFADDSKKIIDDYYSKIYVYSNKCSTLLRARTAPQSDLTILKTKIRDLVVDGLNFE